MMMSCFTYQILVNIFFTCSAKNKQTNNYNNKWLMTVSCVRYITCHSAWQLAMNWDTGGVLCLFQVRVLSWLGLHGKTWSFERSTGIAWLKYKTKQQQQKLRGFFLFTLQQGRKDQSTSISLLGSLIKIAMFLITEKGFTLQCSQVLIWMLSWVT